MFIGLLAKLFIVTTMVRVQAAFKIPWTLAVGYAGVHAALAWFLGTPLSTVALSVTFVLLICHVLFDWLEQTEETLMYWPILVIGTATLAFFPADVFGFLADVDVKATELAAR
ncbi:MAG: hypothetical protein ACFBZ8_11695 [Opitutales bacterium]